MSSLAVSKVSDLEGCYGDLLAGASPEQLRARYSAIEVLAAQELLLDGISLQELHDFRERRQAALEYATSGSPHPLVCCGISFFDFDEYRAHVRMSGQDDRDSIMREVTLHVAKRYGGR